jgi:hypothetical protein
MTLSTALEGVVLKIWTVYAVVSIGVSFLGWVLDVCYLLDLSLVYLGSECL